MSSAVSNRRIASETDMSRADFSAALENLGGETREPIAIVTAKKGTALPL
jgi:hypothetical protein